MPNTPTHTSFRYPPSVFQYRETTQVSERLPILARGIAITQELSNLYLIHVTGSAILPSPLPTLLGEWLTAYCGDLVKMAAECLYYETQQVASEVHLEWQMRVSHRTECSEDSGFRRYYQVGNPQLDLELAARVLFHGL